ncbi:MAG: site-specific DNA-methyltransferase [Anaerolineae bacterium]|nr:site-specific DNA-methyltransferase [Anaerolineae bacterium]
MKHEVYQGDCLDVLKRIPSESVDLVYLDPPFFTQKVHRLGTRDRTREFQFPDTWSSTDEYSNFLYKRLQELHRVLRPSGSIFFHCDRNASHIARFLLDEVFGESMFRAEIIWYYRRWSASQKNLLPAHQNILFYSKTYLYKFNVYLTDYSPATNIEQILQKRKRDEFGKAIYSRDEQGEVIPNGLKKGVPLSDVWDIPFLNPKARERTGYPTQKPVLLLERVIELVTEKGDTVLDPFCGSGTTLVAAKLLERSSIGIDVSDEAIEITRGRLENPVKTQSHLLEVGRVAYRNVREDVLQQLTGLDLVPVQRNDGIDALLRVEHENGSIPIRVQRPGETLAEAASSLYRATRTKRISTMIVVSTQEELDLGLEIPLPPGVVIVDSTARAIEKVIQRLASEQQIQANESRLLAQV